MVDVVLYEIVVALVTAEVWEMVSVWRRGPCVADKKTPPAKTTMSTTKRARGTKQGGPMVGF